MLLMLLPIETAAKLKYPEINDDYLFLCRNLPMILGGKSGVS
jgi:hypothetical protein